MYCNKRLSLLKPLGITLIFIWLCGCASKSLPPTVSDELSAQALQKQDDIEQFQMALALLDGDEADKQNAKSLFDDLYASNHHYIGAKINSADILFSLDQQQEAKSSYLEVVNQLTNATPTEKLSDHENPVSELVPEHEQSKKHALFLSHTYNQLGLIARQKGQFSEAETYYRKALVLNDSNPKTIKNLAILLDLYQGKLKEAYELYLRYEELVGETDPKIKDWLYDLKNRLPAEDSREK